MTEFSNKKIDRRPIKARSTAWAKSLASLCVKADIQADHVSLASLAFASLGGICLFMVAYVSSPFQAALFVFAAVSIQMRLLCNLIDGMVAVEGKRHSNLGVLFNELPDRLADTIFLVTAGYAAFAGRFGIELGWAAAVLAVLTAYIRAFGASLGCGQDFSGPIAKPHRMFALTVACLLSAVEALTGMTPQSDDCCSRYYCCRDNHHMLQTHRAHRKNDRGQSWMNLVAGFVQLFTGVQARWVGCAPEQNQRIYFANHTSHFDFLVLWSVLPEEMRRKTTAAGASDYWTKRIN